MKVTKSRKELVDVTTTTTLCDRCSNEIKPRKYSAFDCQLTLRTGDYDGYDNSHWGKDYSVDLCEGCADFVFFTLFPKNDIAVNEED